MLDIGAGAGRAALVLQDEGHDVVALDVSEGATNVCRQRGVRATFTGSVFDLAATAPEPFDTFLGMGNNLALMGTGDAAASFFASLDGLSAPAARLVGNLALVANFGQPRLYQTPRSVRLGMDIAF